MLQPQDTLENITGNVQNEILSFYHQIHLSKDAKLTENIQIILEDAILFNSQDAWKILERNDYELPHLSGEYITTILSGFIEDTFIDVQIIMKAIQTPLINSAILSLSDRALCSAKSPILMAMLIDVGLVNLSDVISFAFSLLVNEDEYCNEFAHKILKTMSVMIFNEFKKTEGLIIEMAIGVEPGSVKISINNNENNEDCSIVDIRWQDSYKGTISLVAFVQCLFEAIEKVMTPENLTYGLEIIRFINGERGRLNMFVNGHDIEKIILDDNFDAFKSLLIPLAPQELSEWILRKSEEILSCNNEEYNTQEDYDPIDDLKNFYFLKEDENGNLYDVCEDEEMKRLRNGIGIIDVRIAKSIRTWQDIIAACGGYHNITFMKNHSYIMGRAASDSIRTLAVKNIRFQLPQQKNSSFDHFWNFIGLGKSSINPADFTGILNCRGKQTMGEYKYYNLISYLVQNKNGLTAEEIVHDNDSQFSIQELSMALSGHNHRALEYILYQMSSIEVSMNLGTLLMVSTTTGNLKGIRLILEKIINDTQFMEKQIIDITNTIHYLNKKFKIK
ncbi:hypothetical protein TRFO_39630 [Tritrichomonas foetus]|uniref:Uncharacterized protein n=1 Tax=Tritrichomonas foetus TaxID=1144522 RepID=A0A1J4J403_9EUKA|nr:hypothetical protein TRFO_39630 [Tritrichomonas foetus]|eukprot:OHS94158.1 hypothetical protein TRFO_39630 [Tritrichomonas foetus]